MVKRDRVLDAGAMGKDRRRTVEAALQVNSEPFSVCEIDRLLRHLGRFGPGGLALEVDEINALHAPVLGLEGDAPGVDPIRALARPVGQGP